MLCFLLHAVDDCHGGEAGAVHRASASGPDRGGGRG